MCFQLVPKSVILNKIERRTGLYFTLFHRIGRFWGPLRKRSWLPINRFSPGKCHKVH